MEPRCEFCQEKTARLSPAPPFFSTDQAGISLYYLSSADYHTIVEVTFAAAASGRTYFDKFMEGLSAQDQAAILAVFSDIQTCGLDAKGCEFRQIEGKLWEIKIRAPTGGYRFFYVMLSAGHIHVLHSYQKQGERTPMKGLAVARRRLKEVLRHEK